jgi:hypothetical protein
MEIQGEVAITVRITLEAEAHRASSHRIQLTSPSASVAKNEGKLVTALLE